MKASTLTPNDLFGMPCQYIVPLFQRPYVWNEEEQWAPLWEDVRSVAEAILSAGWNESGVGPHFLGAIVLDQQLVPPGSVPQRHVIDGQQRLTTLQLLLDAADEVIRSHGGDDDKHEIGRLVVNKDTNPQRPNDRFKVWPTDRDQLAFLTAMDNDTSIVGDLSKSKIAMAHTFFGTSVGEWALEEGPDGAAPRLHALTRTLTQFLKLVVIDLEPGDNPQVIFEALNHRGAPLLAADLIKNRIFHLAQLAGDDVHALYETHWKVFDNDDWRRKVTQGRLFRPRIDVFMNYWLALQLKREVSTDKIYESFLEYGSGKSPASLLSQLADSREVYDSIERFPAHGVEGNFAYRVLNVMQASVWGPVLLYLYGGSDVAVPLEERQLALRAIESWSVRRMICRYTAKAINQLAIELLRKLLEPNGQPAGQQVLSFLADETVDSRLWPTDAAVREAAAIQPLYTALSRARLRMILEALEDAKRSPLSEDAHCPRGVLTIEHILPQGWGEHWPLEPHDEVVAAKRDRILHTIGNLTLVSKRLNPALSNLPWTDAAAKLKNRDKGKLSLLHDHSDMKLTRIIEDTHADHWGEDTIATRAIDLSDEVVKVWPSSMTMSISPHTV